MQRRDQVALATRSALAETHPATGNQPRTLRSATDAERQRVERFCVDHPEYARLGHEPLLQVASTFLDDEDLALRGELRAAGVPMGWRRSEGDDEGVRMAEEL